MVIPTKRKRILTIVLALGLAMLIHSFGALNVHASDTLKIAVVGPMKFPAGEHMWDGAELAAKEINDRGGVLIDGNVFKIDLIKADSNEYRSVPDAVNALVRVITSNKEIGRASCRERV